MIQLRPYQQTVIDNIFDWFYANPVGNPIVSASVGAGKSIIIAELCRRIIRQWPNQRILMAVASRELVMQNYEKLRHIYPEADAGLYSGSLGKKNPHAQIVFATINSIYSKAMQTGAFNLCLVDECFVAGTLIDTPLGKIKIEDLTTKDIVISAIGESRIINISKKTTKNLVEVRLKNGKKIKCTKDHPFFTTEGWIEASALEGKNVIGTEDMSALWSDFQAKNIQKWTSRARKSMGDSRLLLPEMLWNKRSKIKRSRKNNLKETEKIKGESRSCQKKSSRQNPSMRILQSITCEESEMLQQILCKEITESNAFREIKGEEIKLFEKNKSQAQCYWRKWQAINSTANSNAFNSWEKLDSRIGNKNTCWSQKRGLPKLLQSRHWKCKTKNSNRDGWTNPFWKKKRTGLEKRQLIVGIGVESVSNYKQNSIEAVYNLQVERHPSYFANGILVHNCHNINRKETGMYRQMITDYTRLNPKFRTIGFTGTEFRGNGVLLTEGTEALFTDVAAKVSIRDLLDQGFLSPLVVQPMQTKTDVTSVSINHATGDYNIKQLANAIDKDNITQAAVDEMIAAGKDRKAWLVFGVNIEHCHHIHDALTKRGINSAVVHGKTPKSTRDRILSDYKYGRIRALVNCMILTTGFDYPGIDLIALIRNTKSPVLYCLDEETEVLTSHGWLGNNQVKTGDCALSMDVSTGKGEWSTVTGVINREMTQEEKWVEYKAPRANFRVTDNHRMIFKTKKNDGYTIDSALKMSGYKDSIYMPTAVHIDNAGVPLNDDELYLIGIIMSDGTIRPNQLFISQSERYPEILTRIENTLNRLGLTWRKSLVAYSMQTANMNERFPRWVFHISMGKPRKGTEKRSALYLYPYLNKDLSPALMMMTRHQFIQLWNGLFDGDGCKMKYEKTWVVRSSTIVSARKECVDRLQALAVMHGFTANLRWAKKGRTSPIAYLTIKDQDWRSVGGCGKRPQVTISDATKESVWCIETSSGTIVTRRKGKVTVMGNCQIAGRGLRTAPGKQDCLWLDFTNTTETLGPIDQIKGRKESKVKKQGALKKPCPKCLNDCHFGATHCQCGHEFELTKDEKLKASSGNAPILFASKSLVEIASINYRVHKKPGSLDSLCIIYAPADMRKQNIKEWICFNHEGYARRKAENWWLKMGGNAPIPETTYEAMSRKSEINKPDLINVKKNGKYDEIINYVFNAKN